MYTLEGKTFHYAIDESGRCVSVYNKLTALSIYKRRIACGN